MGVRRHHSSLSKAEKDRFVAALKKMKADTAAPYNYDKFVQIHATIAASTDPDQNPAHRGPAFCPWHRYLLAKFELDLQAADRKLGGDGTLMLPYWDWTREDPVTLNTQPGGMWHKDFMGGLGSPVTGPFSSWKLAPPGQGPLARGLGTSPLAIRDNLPRDAQVQLALASPGFDSPPYSAGQTGAVAGLTPPPAPAATGASGGTLAPGRYRVVTTYVNAPGTGQQGETRPSPPTIVCLGSGCAPVNASTAIAVSSPAPRAGALGYRIYVSPANGAAGTEALQGGLIAIGTSKTIGSLLAGKLRPSVNTTSSFRNLLEGWASMRPQGQKQEENHNNGHTWVGGSMLPSSSPDDPVFFMHHCNVDRLWALWQLRHPGQNYPPVVPKVGGAGNRPEGLNDPLPPWNTGGEIVRPIDVLNHTSFKVLGKSVGYTYDSDPPGVVVDVSA